MKPKTALTLGVLAGLPLLAGILFLKRGREAAPQGVQEAPSSPTAPVETQPILQGSMGGELPGTGSMVAAPGALRTLALPCECRVLRIEVREGQFVAAGTPLAVVAASPEAGLALEQARIDLKAAAAGLKQAQERRDLQLNDQAQLAQARQAFESAQARLKSLDRRLPGETRTLTATGPWIVVHIAAQAGALLQASSPLMEGVDPMRLEARIGLDPQACEGLKEGGPVELQAMGPGPRLQGTLRSLAPAIDPSSHLRWAYVSVRAPGKLLFGQPIQARFQLPAVKGLLIPYAAALPEEGRQVIYTVQAGHAQRHEVEVLAQRGDRLEVAGPGLKAGDPVVVQGNYELQDGMAVSGEARR